MYKKTQNVYNRLENDYHLDLDNLLDIEHADALEQMKINGA